MDENKLAAAFNQWMKKYLTDRKAGDDLFETDIREFEADLLAGREPRYGEETVQILKDYLA